MQKQRWRFLGYILFFGGVAVFVFRALRRIFHNEIRPLPPPDRIIGGGGVATRPAPQAEQMGGPGPQPAAPDAALSFTPPSPSLSTPANNEVIADSEIAEQDAPPPPPRPLALPSGRGVSFGVGTESNTDTGSRDTDDLWNVLQNEAYRQRGEGYRKDWAFHTYAAKHNLGAPLATTASSTERIEFEGKQYGFQPFARDTLFNEIPHWGKVQSLNALLGGKMPEGGLGLKLLQATYQRCGSELHTDWSFHRVALEKQLGPSLGENYRITVEGAEYAIQVFGCDTLYTPVPHWSDVRRLSDTPPGALRDALWTETHNIAGNLYQPDDPFHQLAASSHPGTPLSDRYTVDMEGTTLQVQVFALDVFYAQAGGSPLRQSELIGTDAPVEEPEAPAAPDSSSPTDALSSKHPVFTMMPVAGQPRISQFYGYTKYAAGKGSQYYRFCQGRHPGIDFAVPEGTPLLSIGYGVVACAGVSNRDCPFGGCPPMIVIVRYGSVYAIYGHASAVKVQKGQFVKPGDVLCLSGTYGGPHLHFEIRPVPEKLLNNTDPNQTPVNPGYAVNPVDYFSQEMNDYFEQSLARLGGTGHFCCGTFRDQEKIVFGGVVDTRPCTNP
jgi:murein DD-endopeptidase MepM/ murein hydrolase activator NlpD